MSNARIVAKVFGLSIVVAIMSAAGCATRPKASVSSFEAMAMQAPFQHVVHFWLRDDLTDKQKTDFVEGVRSLGNSPNVAAVRVAVPAHTPREIVDNSYDVQLTVWFDSSEAHDAYQSPNDEAHTAFGQAFKPFWKKVLIYDSILE